MIRAFFRKVFRVGSTIESMVPDRMFESEDLCTEYAKVRSERDIEAKLTTLISKKDFSDVPRWLIAEALAEKGKGYSAAALLGCWAFQPDRDRVRLMCQCVKDKRLSLSGDTRLERDMNHLDMALRIEGLSQGIQTLRGNIGRLSGTVKLVDRMIHDLV